MSLPTAATNDESPLPLPPRIRFELHRDGSSVNLWVGEARHPVVVKVNADPRKILTADTRNEQQLRVFKCWGWPDGSWRPRRSGRRVILRRVRPIHQKPPVIQILVPGKTYEGSVDGVLECDYGQSEQMTPVRYQPI